MIIELADPSTILIRVSKALAAATLLAEKLAHLREVVESDTLRHIASTTDSAISDLNFYFEDLRSEVV